MNTTPIKYHDEESGREFYIPIPAVTIDRHYEECPYHDYNIFLCCGLLCEDCLRSTMNVEYLKKI